MAITNPDQLVDALANNSSRVVIDKASLANQTAGRFASWWRATGQPGQGAIPTVAALCDNTLAGCFGFAQQTAPATSYLAWLGVTPSNAAQGLEIHDRLAHMGGLSLNVNTLQTTNLPLDLEALGLSAARRGDANFSDIQAWLEVYADGGATASNATINVRFNDNADENLNVQAVGGTIRAGNLFPLTPLKTTTQQTRYIKRINSVQLATATGAAGNFGFTFTRPRTMLNLDLANRPVVADWPLLGLPEVPNGACLFGVVIPSTTSTGTFRGQGKIAHG